MNKLKKIVAFTGAGISAESGLKTFRDSDGLWEGYRVEDVATPEAWRRDQKMVLEFYNERRKAVIESKPNKAHLALAELERKFDLSIVTQNIDDLHERAGSTKIIHLHGEILKSRSTKTGKLYDIDGPLLNQGQLCEAGAQLRPHVVWFGEEVPEIPNAARLVSQADIFLIIGTSLAVYPAASLVEYVKREVKIYLVDPKPQGLRSDICVIAKKASDGVPELVDKLLA